MTPQSHSTQFIGYPTNNIVEMKNQKQCRLPVFMTAIVLLFCSAQLWAQSSDTLFVIEKEFVYDTLFVHDTLHIHDTITIDKHTLDPEFEQLFNNLEFIDNQILPDSLKKIFKETVTFGEDNVFDIKREKFSSMDSIKKYGLVGLIILGLNALAPAQQDNSIGFNQNKGSYPKHEIGLSYGFAPYVGTFYKGSFEDVSSSDYSSFRELLFGSFNFQYHLLFNKLHGLDFNLTWSACKHTKPGSMIRHYAYKNEYVHYLSIQAGYSIHYFNTGMISLYSSIYLGATLFIIGDAAYYDDGINHFSEVPNDYPLKKCYDLGFGLQINYLGISIGKNNAANIELGLGTQGLLKIGYSYKF